MMMPSISPSSSSSSSWSVTKMVDKATSELLAGPDWTINMEICDICNSNHWMAKDVVKEVKRRLQHKNPKVQLLALTLLETMVKNCGEYIHYSIAERKIVDEMVKIVKKKTDIHVRDKILALLDSWQEAFGGVSGKYSQYFWACDELRRYGIQFPQRSQHTAPVITPPVTHPTAATQIGFVMPSNSSTTLDEAMNSEVEGLSFSTLDSMRSILELLDDMLQAINPNDRMAVKDEVIVDLVDRCRANHRKLLQMITTTTDEDLLVKGIEVNDAMQLVLGKHDAIASGAPLPSNGVQPSELLNSSVKTNEVRDKNPATSAVSSGSPTSVPKDQAEDEEEDEFALLARRHSKAHSTPTTISGATDDVASSSSNALTVIDVPAHESTTTNASSKEQDLIDLLSIVLTTNSTPETPEAPTSEIPQAPTSAVIETTSQAPLNSYVVPWAQPQLQTPYRPMQTPMQPQFQQPIHSQYSSSYPAPPWEATTGYFNNRYPGTNPYANPPSLGSMNSSIPSQNFNSFQNTQYGNQFHSTAQTPGNSSISPIQGGQSLNGNFYPTPQSTVSTESTVPVTNGSGSSTPSGQKAFIPSYKLFEDLNVFGSSEGKLKSGPYASSSGNPSQNMTSGRR